MPVEIKELHIKAVVVAEQQQLTQPMEINTAKLKREITDDVFRKVLLKLKQKNER